MATEPKKLSLAEAMERACAAEPTSYVAIDFTLSRHIIQREGRPWEASWSVWNGRLLTHFRGDSLEEALADFLAAVDKSNGVNPVDPLEQAALVDDLARCEDRPGDGFAPEEV
jgi:hypothetical protein